MPGRARTAWAAIFLSVAGTLAPVPSLAIPVSIFVSQQDQSLQAKELQDAINDVVGSIENALRSAVDAHGNPKTAEQMRLDSERADSILDIVNHRDHDKLALMILDANKRQPNVDLEKVVIAYIPQELQRQPAR